MENERKEKVKEILMLLKKEYAGYECALHFRNPLELLVATILSAQCTDERVNATTPALFKRFRTAKDYADAEEEEIEKYIMSTGFYKNKAKNIKNSCKMIVENFDGRVPNSMKELIQLPGVARKTANVVLSVAFKKHEGIAVDTHVLRLTQRLGLTRQKQPEKIEEEMMQIVSKENWWNFSNVLIWHGRKICQAKKPHCSVCILKNFCPSHMKLAGSY